MANVARLGDSFGISSSFILLIFTNEVYSYEYETKGSGDYRMTTAPIYVETHIDHTVDEVWAHTQTPEVHQRWDVRFTGIDYLDAVEGEPQQFVYATTVAPGLAVSGRGETLGERHRADGTAYSGLKFWSDHPISLIAEGAGFWRYVPTPTGVRFLTRYDYRVRWGILGRTLDRFFFRPAFGWGTAWSFDRLRLWIERGIAPERSRNQTLVHLISVLTLAFIWIYDGIYRGIVPKLLSPYAGELDLPGNAGAGFGNPRLMLTLLGIGEALFGLAVLRWWRQRWPFMVTLLAMPALTLSALVGDSAAFVRPFNPITLDLALMALAAMALLSRNDLPSGRAPLRRPPAKTDIDTSITKEESKL